MKSKVVSLLILIFCASATASPGYFRFPALYNNTLVFTAEGDLWVTELGQSNAVRLTTHIAEETQAAISKDGQWVAYVANYEGASEAYVIPLKGGFAKQISFENSFVKVHGWTSKGEVIYSSNNRVGPSGNWTLKIVNPESLLSHVIPLADASEGGVDPQGKYIYFSQYDLQVSGDNVKTYRGGAKGEIWRFQLGSEIEAQRLSIDHVGSARRPMVNQNRVYFISDASGIDNLWSMSLDGKNFQQITQSSDWPVRTASLDKERLVYQLGADLYLLDLKTNESSKLTIQLTSDFPNLRQRWVNQPLKYLTSSHVAGKLPKVVLTARGRVALATNDNSRLVEINTPMNSRTREAILSHDGKSVYALNDVSGEMEIWQFAADGSAQSKQLTHDGHIFRWQLSLSPDGKTIASDDLNGELWLLDLASGKNRKILSQGAGLDPYASIVWSTDSRYLAIAELNQNDERSRIRLYSLNDDKSVVLTSDKYESYSPTFSRDGNWLYFLSERAFSSTPESPWGDRNTGAIFDRRVQIFAYALNKNARFPFQLPNELKSLDDVSMNQKTDIKDQTNKRSAKGVNVVSIDWDGIQERLWQVPVDSGNYASLQASESYLYVKDQISEPNSKPLVKSISIEASPKVEVFSEGVEQFELSLDGKKIFVRKQGNDNTDLFIANATDKLPDDTKDTKVLTSAWQMRISPQAEWQQMFHDAWLMHRDSLYDRKMRGVNWQQMHAKYRPLLQRITDRYELNDIFSQMMGEVSTLHSQIRGGDYPQVTDIPSPSSLGATLLQTKKGVLIDHIYRYDRELPALASPLLKPGVDAQDGDLILAINGLKIKNIAEAVQALMNQSDKQVLLELSRDEKSHKTLVVPTPINQERVLIYNDWVMGNRQKVEEHSSQIGYIHLYAMGNKDFADFVREFYAAYQKDGMIIDVRRNRGGNIDSWIIEKLLRKVWMFWQSPIGPPSTNMQQTFRGHLVVLADQMTYSDGETFTAGIKALKLAPVIGKQTAGAGVWLRGLNSLVDGGIARVAEFPQYATDGRWIIEGHGVEPDIEVDNLPFATFNGHDAQLQTAIDYLKNKLVLEPIPKLKSLPFPETGNSASDILP